MIHKPILMHKSDDDSAPVDYTFVQNVSEGRRRRQEMNMKKEGAEGVVVRHRADPFERSTVDEYGTRSRFAPTAEALGKAAPRHLPSAADGPAPATSVAYPEADGIPDNPFVAPTAVRRERGVSANAQMGRGSEAQGTPAARTALDEPAQAATAMPTAQPAILMQDGSAFDAPVRPSMPEWLRVAQQNNLSVKDRRASAPRVSAASRPAAAPEAVAPPTDVLGRPLRNRARLNTRPAEGLPQTAEDYERAGYPLELLRQQQAIDHEHATQHEHRQHGAQYATRGRGVQSVPDEKRVGAPPIAGALKSHPAARETLTYNRTASRGEGEPASRRNAYPEEGGIAPSRTSRRMELAQTAATDNSADANHIYAQETYAIEPSVSNPYARPRAAHQPLATKPNHNQEMGDVWQDEESEQSAMHQQRPPIPWLGIGMFVAAILAVGLWLLQLTFTAQTEQVIRARKENNDAIRNRHPFRYQELIEREAEKNNINPAFVAAIVLNESSYNPKAESSVGARGLMQLMDKSAEWIHEKMGTTEAYSFDLMYDAPTNVLYGCWYIAFLNERFRGDPVLVSAAFHAGQNQVQNWLNDSRYSADNLTLELENMKDGPTKQYATRVVRDYAVYKRLYYETATN